MNQYSETLSRISSRDGVTCDQTTIFSPILEARPSLVSNFEYFGVKFRFNTPSRFREKD